MVARGGSPTQRKVNKWDPRAYLARRKDEAEEEDELPELRRRSDAGVGSSSNAPALRGSENRLNNLRLVVWTTFDDPSSSITANVISTSMMVIIIVSIGNFTFGSFPDDFCAWKPEYTADGVDPDEKRMCSVKRIEDWTLPNTIEAGCIFCFTVEYLLRLFTCSVVMPAWRFVLDPLNMLDLVAIMPWYITEVMSLLFSGENGMAKVLGIVRIVRLTRILRVFKASKEMKMMLVLARTMARSGVALSILLVTVLGMMLFFGAVIVVFERGAFNPTLQIYLREDGAPTPFYSIPNAMYWCMATMTTVGYGDLYPVTGYGQVVGYFTILLGIVVLSLPITVIGSTFSEEFEEQNRIEERERRLRQLKMQEKLDEMGLSELPRPPSVMRRVSGKLSSWSSRSPGEKAPAPAPASPTRRLSLKGLGKGDGSSKKRGTRVVPGLIQSEWLLSDYRSACTADMKQFILRSESDLLRLTRKVIIQSRVCVRAPKAKAEMPREIEQPAVGGSSSSSSSSSTRDGHAGHSTAKPSAGHSTAKPSATAPSAAGSSSSISSSISSSSSSSSSSSGSGGSSNAAAVAPFTPAESDMRAEPVSPSSPDVVPRAVVVPSPHPQPTALRFDASACDPEVVGGALPTSSASSTEPDASGVSLGAGAGATAAYALEPVQMVDAPESMQSGESPPEASQPPAEADLHPPMADDPGATAPAATAPAATTPAATADEAS